MELPDKQRTLCLLQIKVLVTCWLRKEKRETFNRRMKMHLISSFNIFLPIPPTKQFYFFYYCTFGFVAVVYLQILFRLFLLLNSHFFHLLFIISQSIFLFYFQLLAVPFVKNCQLIKITKMELKHFVIIYLMQLIYLWDLLLFGLSFWQW